MDLRSQLASTLGAAYRLERELGGGGMSRVFAAEETRLRRKVVVKVLSPELAAGVEPLEPTEGHPLGPVDGESRSLQIHRLLLEVGDRVEHERRVRLAGGNEFLLDAHVDLGSHALTGGPAAPAAATAGAAPPL